MQRSCSTVQNCAFPSGVPGLDPSPCPFPVRPAAGNGAGPIADRAVQGRIPDLAQRQGTGAHDHQARRKWRCDDDPADHHRRHLGTGQAGRTRSHRGIGGALDRGSPGDPALRFPPGRGLQEPPPPRRIRLDDRPGAHGRRQERCALCAGAERDRPARADPGTGRRPLTQRRALRLQGRHEGRHRGRALHALRG